MRFSNLTFLQVLTLLQEMEVHEQSKPHTHFF